MSRFDERVVYLSDCQFRIGEAVWPFAERNRDEIAAHWARRTAENPDFFNGTVFVLRDVRVDGDVLRGTYAATDFASYLYWRETGFQDETTYDGFVSAILRAADGGYLVGQATAGGLNEGYSVIPGGFADPADVDSDGNVDVAGTALRELHEEAGIEAGMVQRIPGYFVAFMGPLVGMGVPLVAHETGEEVLQRVRAYLEASAAPELHAPRIVVDPSLEGEAPGVRLLEGTRLLIEAFERHHGAADQS